MSSSASFPTRMSTINGISIKDLAEKYGTPFYVYDLDTIRKHVEELLPLGTVRYAVKANSSVRILSYLRSLGVVADCVSEGEICRAMEAGWKNGLNSGDHFPTEIVYTCDIFDRRSLKLVTEKNITVNCGSIDMISQLGEQRKANPELNISDRITIRINPGFGHGHSQKTNTGGPSSKHGIWFEDLELVKRTAGDYDLRISGVHLHIGSGSDFEHLKEVCNSIQNYALQFKDTLEMVSVGGGLPTPYKNGENFFDVGRFTNICIEAKKNIESVLGRKISLEVEPGRYLVADSGYLVAEVRAIKRMGHLTYYLVDAGFNDLARPVLYGSYHHISLVAEDCSEDLSPTHEVVVAGPLCESGDVFTQEEGGFVSTRELPVASVGDYLVFHTTGAYGASMSSNYNSKPYCPEIVIDSGVEHLVRQRGNIMDLYKDEIFQDVT